MYDFLVKTQALYVNQQRRIDLFRATQPLEQLSAATASLAVSYRQTAVALLAARGDDCFRAQFALHAGDASAVGAGRMVVTVLVRPAGPGAAAPQKPLDDEDDDMK